MIDERNIAMYNAEMVKHTNGTDQFLSSSIGGQNITKNLVREAMDFLLASAKRNIESCPNVSQREKRN